MTETMAAAFVESWRPFRGWMLDDALPFWATKGVDRTTRGFFETMTRDGNPVEAPRRTRLVARQTFVFSMAAQKGWLPGAADLAAHGFEALTQACVRSDGLMATRYDPGTGETSSDLDLYDQAFALFAYAHAAAIPKLKARAEMHAVRLLGALAQAGREDVTGFGDFRKDSIRLTNPYLHLFEAAIACAVSFPGDQQWGEIAQRLARHCSMLINRSSTGAIAEVYDRNWGDAPSNNETWIEPGHQYEWAWLLLEHSQNSPHAVLSATELVGFAEEHGLSQDRRRVVDSLHLDGRMREGGSRLWQQCERFRAVARLAQFEPDAGRKRIWLDAATSAAGCLTSFLDRRASRLWYDAADSDGCMSDVPVKASSLYHLMGAFLEGEALVRSL